MPTFLTDSVHIQVRRISIQKQQPNSESYTIYGVRQAEPYAMPMEKEMKSQRINWTATQQKQKKMNQGKITLIIHYVVCANVLRQHSKKHQAYD